MSIHYQVRPDNDVHVIGNLDEECAACIDDCSAATEVVKCHCTGRRRRRGLRSISDGTLYVCTDESTKSTRLFNEKVRTVESILPFVVRARTDAVRDLSVDVDRLVHNLVTLNAQAIQAVYNMVPQDSFYQRDRESLVGAISRRLTDSEKTAGLVINLLKIANLEKAEYAGYKKLSEREPIALRNYPIHKIFMLVLGAYWDSLKEKEVFVRIGECRERVCVDYDTITASLVHILNNTVKYIPPRSTLDVSFVETTDSIVLTLNMVSLRIRSDELDKIFHEGFSGEEPKKNDRQGDGIGLYLVKRLLSLSRATLTIKPDCEKERSKYQMGVQFENNVFELAMPRGKK